MHRMYIVRSCSPETHTMPEKSECSYVVHVGCSYLHECMVANETNGNNDTSSSKINSPVSFCSSDRNGEFIKDLLGKKLLDFEK